MAERLNCKPWELEHPDRPPTEAETSMWAYRVQLLTKLGI